MLPRAGRSAPDRVGGCGRLGGLAGFLQQLRAPHDARDLSGHELDRLARRFRTALDDWTTRVPQRPVEGPTAVSAPLYKPLGELSLAELEVLAFALSALWAVLLFSILKDAGVNLPAED